MATLIEQHPEYNILPVGQDVIFTVSNSSVVSTHTNVKFIAKVYISSGNPPNPSTSTDNIGNFKTTPNNAGVGMFDFRPIIESFVKADNLARKGSAYKTIVNTLDTTVPVHLIDKYSGNVNTIRYFFIRFKIEYIDSDTSSATFGDLITTDIKDSDIYQIFNGYIKHTDELNLVGNNFGYNLSNFNLSTVADSFLSNAPATQYANLEDYGTFPILDTNDELHYIKLIYKDSTGSQIGTENIYKTYTNGAYTTYNGYIGMNILFFGCFPANLQGSSTQFNNLVSAGTIQGGSIEVQAFNDQLGGQISKEYTINLNCPTLKGYEPVRLTWLNQWGAWDYYTFTMKSTKTISTKGSTYKQLGGSWNKSTYKLDSFKGGKKAFRVNATEKIKMNTDFVSESDSEWFEDLINSPEVYIVKGYNQTELPTSALNQYIIPVRLTTSSYTKKTIANDKLMQYTFEVEKSKTLRTQAV